MIEYTFPPIPSRQDGDGWMSKEQETITYIYGIFVFVMIAAVALFFAWSMILFVVRYAFPKYKVRKLTATELNLP